MLTVLANRRLFLYAKFLFMRNHRDNRDAQPSRSSGSKTVRTGRNVSSGSPKFLTRKEDDNRRPRFNRTSGGGRPSSSNRTSEGSSGRSRPERSGSARPSTSSRSNDSHYGTPRRESGSRPYGARRGNSERSESRSEGRGSYQSGSRSSESRSGSRGPSRGGNRSFGSRDSRGSGRGRSSGGGYGSRGRSGGGNRRKPKRGEQIDISKFVKKASDNIKPQVIAITHQFADFNLGSKIQKNLQMRNYETPTPIQDQSIPHILDGRDVVGLANTGTGKTGAFLLPLIKKVMDDKKQKVLIMAPTRELANQIDVEFKEFAKHLGIYSCVCIGGAPLFRQIKSLKRRPNFIIGTPGRLKDLHKQKELKLDDVNNIVLDEVDRMLDMGFVHEIREILSHAREDRQSLFFSATMPAPIKTLVKEFLKDPITIETQTGVTTDNVEQDIVEVDHGEDKFDTLLDLLVKPEMTKVLIFAETKRNVEKVTKELIRSGIKADSIHGDKRQRQREKSLDKFATGRVQVLVATDVAARGLDIKDVTHVINYTIPQTFDDYVHRIGRTGRGGNKGHALTFV